MAGTNASACRFYPRCGLVALVAVMLGLSACAITPDPPLTVKPDAGAIDVSAQTFSTRVYPVPGRTGFLRRVEAVVIEQMQALGYRVRAADGDLRIELELQRTDPSTILSQPVHTGRLILRLSAGGKPLRTGYTASLSEIDLDFLSAGQIARRVRHFLQGLPQATPHASPHVTPHASPHVTLQLTPHCNPGPDRCPVTSVSAPVRSG